MENFKKTEIGIVPKEIDFEGLSLTEDVKEELFNVDKESWLAEIKEIEQFYEKLDYIPAELLIKLKNLKKKNLLFFQQINRLNFLIRISN